MTEKYNSDHDIGNDKHGTDDFVKRRLLDAEQKFKDGVTECTSDGCSFMGQNGGDGGCYECGGTSHIRRNCPKLKQWGQEGLLRQYRGGNGERYRGWGRSSKTHIEEVSFIATGNKIDENTLMSDPQNGKQNFILNSGATHHVVTEDLKPSIRYTSSSKWN